MHALSTVLRLRGDTSRWSRRWVTAGALLSLILASASAVAQQAPPKKPGKPAAQGPFDLRRDRTSDREGAVGRSRARAGDCASALAAFDAAIRESIDPVLRRDRGQCHEQLGNPYPAIDDYRAYVAARPDAPDAEQITERLARLEEQVGARGREDGDKSEGGVAASGSVRVSVNAPPDASGAAGSGGSSYDDVRAREKLVDAVADSPLRGGEGWIIGPMVQLPRYIFDRGGASDLAYVVGATLRYATSSRFTVYGDIGYGAVGSAGAAGASGGPALALGGELRLPISRFASDQILVGGALGFERYVVASTRAGLDLLPLHLRAGYRHVFGPAIGLEVVADGGPAYVVPDGGIGGNRFAGFVGAGVALLVAF